MQLLEGDKDLVKRMYENLLHDNRHLGPEILLEGPLVQRNFPNWSMGFRSLSFDELSAKTGFRDLDAETFMKVQVRNSTHPALEMLRGFYEPEAMY